MSLHAKQLCAPFLENRARLAAREAILCATSQGSCTSHRRSKIDHVRYFSRIVAIWPPAKPSFVRFLEDRGNLAACEATSFSISQGSQHISLRETQLCRLATFIPAPKGLF